MIKVRSKQIRDRLDKYFIYQEEIQVSTPEPHWWKTSAENMVEDIGPAFMLGWGLPFICEADSLDEPTWIFAYCPEVMDEDTADMSDEELDDYLSMIEWMGHERLHNRRDEDIFKAFKDMAQEWDAPDPFDSLVAGLDMEEPDDVLVPSELDDLELSNRYNEVRRELLSSEQMANFNPDTQRARDLHSERDALMLELKRRGYK